MGVRKFMVERKAFEEINYLFTYVKLRKVKWNVGINVFDFYIRNK